MSPDEYRELKTLAEEPPAVTVEDVEGPDRTLLYGYMTNRQTLHVYLQDRKIHVLLTTYGWEHPANYLVGDLHTAAALVPDKRVYPESTDADFVRLLINRGAHVPLLPFDPERYWLVKHLTFHGETWEHGVLVPPR